MTDLSNPNMRAALVALGHDPDVVELRRELHELRVRLEDLAAAVATTTCCCCHRRTEP